MVSIARLLKEMPDGYEEACFETNAIQRKRGITEPGDLMMLNMFHLLNGCSLMEISEVARLAKLGEVSDVAFMKRFENSNSWFKWIISKMVTNGAIQYQKPDWLKDYRVIAVDASDVTEKGRSGRLYHLHFALDIFSMESQQYTITAQDVGESLKNFTVAEGDLFVGDRAYGTLSGIGHCLEGGGNFVLRLKTKSFKLYDESGMEVDLLMKLRSLECEGILGQNVYVRVGKHERAAIRICAMKKSVENIAETHKKMRRNESKKQMTISDEAKEFNEYVIVATNLPDSVGDCQVMDLYSLRWQVEIYFKRLKSILNYGELPKRRTESVFAWLNGKMMMALLLEKILGRESFSPSGELYA
jgi:hypothetical protein